MNDLADLMRPSGRRCVGITSHSLYAWKKTFTKPDVVQRAERDQRAEVRRLRAELKRMTEERDILKKAAAYFAKG